MPGKRQTPAEALSRRITERMAKEKLLDPDRADRFSLSLAAGRLKEGDWRLEVESANKAAKSLRKK
jgi:hypothetical protein